jgi:hypothetical protein
MTTFPPTTSMKICRRISLGRINSVDEDKADADEGDCCEALDFARSCLAAGMQRVFDVVKEV